MQTRRYFLAGAAACAASASFSALAQTAADPEPMTEEQRAELRRRQHTAKTEEERARIRREYLRQLRSGEDGQAAQSATGVETSVTDRLTEREREEMRHRLRAARTEEERERIRQEYRERAHLRGQGLQQSDGQGRGGSGQQGKSGGQGGTQPPLLPQGKKGKKR